MQDEHCINAHRNNGRQDARFPPPTILRVHGSALPFGGLHEHHVHLVVDLV